MKINHDHLIYELLNSPRYEVRPDGTVWTCIGLNGKPSQTWREAGYQNTDKSGKTYRYMKFRGKHLKVHRVVYAKFNGQLDANLIVNHKDCNGLNNLPDNLELITQAHNNHPTKHGLAKKTAQAAAIGVTAMLALFLLSGCATKKREAIHILMPVHIHYDCDGNRIDTGK